MQLWYIRSLTGDDRFFTRKIFKVRPSCMTFWTGGKLATTQKELPSNVSQSRAQLAEHHHYFIYLSLFFSLPLSLRFIRTTNRSLGSREWVLSLVCTQCRYFSEVLPLNSTCRKFRNGLQSRSKRERVRACARARS